MPDPAIEEFFQKRKEDWLKKETKASMSDAELQDLNQQCEERFSRKNWIPDAAKRAGQINISSHPCTFSHPSARKNKNGYVTSIIANADQANDGYLRTGNVAVEQDALGNAAALDVYKFLTLSMSDNQPLYYHIENQTPLAKSLLSIDNENYETLKDGFMAMFNSGEGNITSSKIKQVYFPSEDNYHLLSILSNSGLVYELRKRIDDLRFSEHQKFLREKRRNNEVSTEGYSEIHDITTIGYGGTKPQNISVLNNQFGGKARLLMSAPPTLSKRSVQFPKHDFFASCIRYQDIREPINKLHKIFITSLNGTISLSNLRSGRDHRLQDIIDQIILKMIAVRAVSQNQYCEETNNLPHFQQVWLCHPHLDERLQTDTWLVELCNTISQWILAAYKQLIKKPLLLGPAEIAYIQQAVEDNREVFR